MAEPDQPRVWQPNITTNPDRSSPDWIGQEFGDVGEAPSNEVKVDPDAPVSDNTGR